MYTERDTIMTEYLRAQVLQALVKIGLSVDAEEIQFEKPKVAEHGDISTNIAMTLARSAKKNPRQIATELQTALQLDPTRITAVEIAGPGFLNFRFADAFMYDVLAEILGAAAAYGRSAEHANESVNVEWVSANPTGPLHAGHGRQVCIGEMICSLLEWTGWNVTREYYFNNAGQQMHNLALSIRERYLGFLGDDVNEENIQYVGEYISTIAELVFNEFGDAMRSAELDFFRKAGETWCFEAIQKTLGSLNVQHDVFFNEDTLYKDGKIDSVLAELRAQGLVYDSDGAVWLKTTEYGADKDRVIIKSSGEPTYRLPDIAYHREKVMRGYDKLVDIFGADHIATIPDVLASLRAMGQSTDHIDVIIHQMVSFVSEGEAVKMSKRSGNVYYLDDLINDVGKDAVRYFFVMRAAGTHLEFDIELAQEQSEKNPVYYVQYAHARIASIIRFAESEGLQDRENPNLAKLVHESEINLIKQLMEFPGTVQRCAVSYETQHLCTYLDGVAVAFHKFYHDCRVVTEDRELSAARLALCKATRQVLANGFSIIGITAPEKM